MVQEQMKTMIQMFNRQTFLVKSFLILVLTTTLILVFTAMQPDARNNFVMETNPRDIVTGEPVARDSVEPLEDSEHVDNNQEDSNQEDRSQEDSNHDIDKSLDIVHKTNLMFIKTHKCGTSTLVNPFYLKGVRERLNYVIHTGGKHQLNLNSHK